MRLVSIWFYPWVTLSSRIYVFYCCYCLILFCHSWHMVKTWYDDIPQLNWMLLWYSSDPDSFFYLILLYSQNFRVVLFTYFFAVTGSKIAIIACNAIPIFWYRKNNEKIEVIDETPRMIIICTTITPTRKTWYFVL